MTNNPTIDGVSRELLETVVSTCSFTLPEIVYQELRTLLDAPTNDLREHCKQCAEVVKTWPEWKQNCLGGAPVVERQPNVIDLDAANWENIQKAADESSWMPNEYMRNEWVSDVCNFLKYGRAEHPAPPEVAALQSTIAQLQARIAELESGWGEPVAWMYHERAEDGHEYRPLFSQAKWSVLPEGFYKESPLYTAPPAQVEVVADERAEFVNWVRRDWPQAPLSLIRDLLPKDDPHYGEYCDERLQRAWVGWQARACLDATAALNEGRK